MATFRWKKIIMVLLCVVSFAQSDEALSVAVHGDKKAVVKIPEFKPFTMDNSYFYCTVPEHYHLQRDPDKDREYGIYEIHLTAPIHSEAPITVSVSYYEKNNQDFNGYRDFIERNSKNALGERNSAREKYKPVRKKVINGLKAFELSRTVVRFKNPQSKSVDAVTLQEKMYVIPSKNAFYVLSYSAPQEDFEAFRGDFERIVVSFRKNPPQPTSGMKVVMP